MHGNDNAPARAPAPTTPGRMHVTCNGENSRQVAIYPFEICKAIQVGSQQHSAGMQYLTHLMNVYRCWQWSPSMVDWAACSIARHVRLDGLERLVGDIEASKLETQYFQDEQVWVKRPHEAAIEYIPISMKWVKVNKGDVNVLGRRSRFVKREINRNNEELYRKGYLHIAIGADSDVC